MGKTKNEMSILECLGIGDERAEELSKIIYNAVVKHEYVSDSLLALVAAESVSGVERCFMAYQLGAAMAAMRGNDTSTEAKLMKAIIMKGKIVEGVRNEDSKE